MPLRSKDELAKVREARAKRTPLKLAAGGMAPGAIQTIAGIEAHLNSLAHELYAKPQANGTLSRAERELLGAVAAGATDCLRGMDTHAACALELFTAEKRDGGPLVDAAITGDFTPLDAKLRALAEMVLSVAAAPAALTQERIDIVLKAGASPTDIVLAMMIACAEGLFSGRMEGMRAPMAADPENYRPAARNIVANGYMPPRPQAPAVVRRQKPPQG